MSLLLVIGLLLLQDSSTVPPVPVPVSGSSDKLEKVDAHELPSKQQGEVRSQESQNATDPRVKVKLAVPHNFTGNPGEPIFGSTANLKPSKATLKILHVPYGQWVEIEGIWHLHRPDNPMETILVNFSHVGDRGLTPLPTVVVRFGRDPSDIRVGKNTFAKQVTLLPKQTVELDYMREFGDGRPEAPPEKRFEAGQYVSQSATASTPAVTSPPIKETDNKPCVAATSNPDNCLKLEIEPISTSSFTVRTAAPNISSITPLATGWLNLSAEKKALAMLVKDCKLSAATAEVKYTTASNDRDYKPKDYSFSNIELSLELRKASSGHDKPTAEVWLTNNSVYDLISRNTKLRDFLLETAPVTNREVNVKLNLIDPKIVFNNGLLQDGMVEYPLGKNVELHLKLPNP
jgi:hypothetical protein